MSSEQPTGAAADNSQASETKKKAAKTADNQTNFEEDHYDEYDYYNLQEDNKLFKHSSGKGRSKKEASQHTAKTQGQGTWTVFSKLENEDENRKKAEVEKVRHNKK